MATERIAVCPKETPTIAVSLGGEKARARLSALVMSEREFSIRKVLVCAPEAGDSVPEALCEALPNVARLEFARVTGAKGAQAQIAGSLLKSFTAVCGVIGLQPIPLADMPVLTTLQTLLVGLIIYTAGKSVTPRVVGEFLGALGLNIGAGILFPRGCSRNHQDCSRLGKCCLRDDCGRGNLRRRSHGHSIFYRRHPHQRIEKTLSKTLAGMGRL